jgi:hypothetical protein
MNCGKPDRPDRLQLVATLRESLTEAERELANPALFTITRKCIERRVARLRFEIKELEHPTQLREHGHLAEPRGTEASRE